MANYIIDDFHLELLDHNAADVMLDEIPARFIPNDVISYIINPKIATLLSDMFSRKIDVNPEPLKLRIGDILYVPSVHGEYIDNDEITEPTPDNVTVKFMMVKVTPVHRHMWVLESGTKSDISDPNRDAFFERNKLFYVRYHKDEIGCVVQSVTDPSDVFDLGVGFVEDRNDIYFSFKTQNSKYHFTHAT